MKTKNIFAILLALTLLTSTFVVPVSAKEPTVKNTNVEIIIHDEVSEETKEKIEKYFASGEPVQDDNAITYGLTCTLLGHKLETTTVSTVIHKSRASAPRCLKKTYNVDTCTRCDYETSELIRSQYIYCCS